MVTLQGEREDAKWTLLRATVNVQARGGESITAPATDYRQQRSVDEFVEISMLWPQHYNEVVVSVLLIWNELSNGVG